MAIREQVVMLEFVIVNADGHVILQASTRHAVTRLSRTVAFAGTPMQVVFGTLQPLDTITTHLRRHNVVPGIDTA